MASLSASEMEASNARSVPEVEFLTNFEVLQVMQNRDAARSKAQGQQVSKEVAWLEKQVKNYLRRISKIDHISSESINSFITALQECEVELGLQFTPGEILQLVNHIPSTAMQLQALMDPSRVEHSDADILTPEQEDIILSLVQKHLLGN